MLYQCGRVRGEWLSGGGARRGLHATEQGTRFLRRCFRRRDTAVRVEHVRMCLRERLRHRHSGHSTKRSHLQAHSHKRRAQTHHTRHDTTHNAHFGWQQSSHPHWRPVLRQLGRRVEPATTAGSEAAAALERESAAGCADGAHARMFFGETVHVEGTASFSSSSSFWSSSPSSSSPVAALVRSRSSCIERQRWWLHRPRCCLPLTGQGLRPRKSRHPQQHVCYVARLGGLLVSVSAGQMTCTSRVKVELDSAAQDKSVTESHVPFVLFSMT